MIKVKPQTESKVLFKHFNIKINKNNVSQSPLTSEMKSYLSENTRKNADYSDIDSPFV